MRHWTRSALLRYKNSAFFSTLLGVHSTNPHWLPDTIVVYGLFRNSLRLACGSRRLHRQFTPPRQLFPCPAWVSPGGQSRIDREPEHFLIHLPARKPACSTHRVLRAWVCSRFRLAPCAAHCGPNVFPAPIAAWERQLLRVR